jgi:diguanylate cyclase (GGDEF)-like protein
VLFVDLDHFKPVNDDLGHPAGDQVLVEVADRLVHVLRPGDLVARIGGDEFAVLCERLADPDDIVPVADRLLGAVSRPIVLQPDTGERVHVGVSIGVTDLAPGEPADTALARADVALREAKGAGRARWIRVRPPG